MSLNPDADPRPRRTFPWWVPAVVVLAIVVVVVVLIVAFNNDDDDDGDSDERPAAADVLITEPCSIDGAKWVAQGTVTNGTSKESNYSIDVRFVGADGDEVDESTANVDDVAPGAVAQWRVESDEEGIAGCQLADVDRRVSA